MHWTEALTARLSDSVKLVGSQLSCEGAPAAGDASAEWRRNPRVLPHAFATDKEGWEALAAEPAIWRCYSDPWDVRYHSDAGARWAGGGGGAAAMVPPLVCAAAFTALIPLHSAVILNRGWNLDTLMPRYQVGGWVWDWGEGEAAQLALLPLQVARRC